MSAEPVDPTGDAGTGRDPGRPSPPDSHPAADANAARPVDAGSETDAEPGTPEPTDDDRKSTRPLDWDGSFSRTWNARYGRDWTNELAAEQAREWEDEEVRQSLKEARDRMNAESAQAEARAREDRRGPSSAGDGGRESARERLARKLDKLDRLSDADSDESGDAG
ncbi:hypothetical protein [Frankia tisae]|uniref:hypothetical protein n=1 Tax=Frankia tisae TaxID=2950104 RepID=UPI0021BF06EA|nr:hypothetical protein [Frankia tisae]